jgi:voltage-gated potassium channel Kch
MSAHAPTRNLVLVALGALALYLGYVGYQEHLSNIDALYGSIQLFVLQGEPPAEGSWQLDVARFLAPAVLGYAAVVAVLGLVRERSQALRVRLLARRHLVIVGLGARGVAIARRMRAARMHVVAVEKNASNDNIAGLRSQGVPVVIGDGRDPGVLQMSRVAGAKDVLIVTGDDSTNLEVLAAIHRLLTDQPGARPMMNVAIDDLGLWRELHVLAFSRADRAARTEVVSFPDRIAAQLVSAAAAALPSPKGLDHVLVFGSGPVATRVVAHAVRRSQAFGNRTRVTFAGPDAVTLGDELRIHEPWCMEVAETGRDDGAEPSVAFVCGLDQADVLAAGAALARRFDRARTALFVSVPGEETEEALAATRYVLDRLDLVPAEAMVLGPDLFAESSTELIARAKHDEYLASERARGVTAAVNASMVPWESLPESLRESNRLFADSLGGKLAELGGSLAPLSGAAPMHQFSLPDDLLEKLARAEHERWKDSLAAEGWQPTKGAKDPERKRHPSLVDWEELPEAEREKDRDAIRSLPAILAAAGYEVVLPAAESLSD